MTVDIIQQLQSLSFREIAPWCIVIWAALCVFAIFCVVPKLARGFAISAGLIPGALLGFWAALTMTSAEQGTSQTVSLLALIVAVIFAFGWVIWLDRSHVLEHIHHWLGRRIIPHICSINGPAKKSALDLFNGWIDPLYRVGWRVDKLIDAQTPQARQTALSKALDTLVKDGYVLSRECRVLLESIADEQPEAHILLAEHNLMCGQAQQAAAQLAALEQALLTNVHSLWMRQEIEDVFGARLKVFPELNAPYDNLRAALLVAEFDSAEDQQRGLQHVVANVAAQPELLTDAARKRLHIIAHRKPAAALILAEDTFARRRPAAGFIQLAQMLRTQPADSWIAAAAYGIWERHAPATQSATQQALWQARQGRPLVLTTLAMLALDHGLAPSIRQSLRDTPQDADTAFLRMCDSLHEGRMSAALPYLTRHQSQIPAYVLQQRVLPRLRTLASESAVAHSEWFSRHTTRPQLQEIVDAPLTWIYGGRVAGYSYAGQPQPYAITGIGPAGVREHIGGIIHDLAYARNCRSDVILAGCTFFDPAAPPRNPRQAPAFAAILRRSEHLAERLNGSGAWREAQQHQQSILTQLADRLAQMDGHLAKMALTTMAREVGFVENRTIDVGEYQLALESLKNNTVLPVRESFPTLAPYRHNGRPLAIKLSLQWLGADSLSHVAHEYRRSVRAELLHKWEQRQRTYVETAREFITAYQNLTEKKAQFGPARLLSQHLFIYDDIDPATGAKITRDQPRWISELAYLRSLPELIATQLIFLAGTMVQIEALSKADSVQPHWERAYLIDALLRGCQLPTTDEQLTTAYLQWSQEWRSLALAALDSELRVRGVAPAAVAVENTIFRLIGEADGQVILGLYHIWDPYHDPLPTTKAGLSLFTPRFSARRKACVPARAAQEEAVRRIGDVLIEAIAPAEGLRALTWDSGKAMDIFIQHLCQPLLKPDLDQDIERVLAKIGHNTQAHLTRWDRVCYDIAEGDTALALAEMLEVGGWGLGAGEWDQRAEHVSERDADVSSSRATAEKMLTTIKAIPIAPAMVALTQRRDSLATALERKLAAGAATELYRAETMIRHTRQALFAHAEAAYRRAAGTDAEGGSAWVRLARLNWRAGQFKQALDTLIGPYAEAELASGQLPLSVAVRIAGGHIAFEPGEWHEWNGPVKLDIKTSRLNNDLILDGKQNGKTIGRCRIAGLAQIDMSLLDQFFRRHQPTQLRSAGEDSFEMWLRLVQTPSIGWRATIANDTYGESRFVLLAACVYLGGPHIFGRPTNGVNGSTTQAWLEDEVVTELTWAVA
jgi:hypothetical protein